MQKTYISGPTTLIYEINCAIKPVFFKILSANSYFNFALKFIITAFFKGSKEQDLKIK